MTAVREPVVPQFTDEQGGPRLSSALREIIQTLMRSGMFLARPSIDRVIVPSNAAAVPTLRWNSLNRIFLTADYSVFLPRIEPRFVGAPLTFILLDTGSNVATLTPSGFGLASPARPLINGAATLNNNTPGMHELRTDGQNWFLSR